MVLKSIMRAAVIDIGSNSTKLMIGEDVDGELKILNTLKNVIGIGQSTFFNGSISQETFSTVITVLENYKKVLHEYKIDTVKVIATTAVREAVNREVFLDTVSRRTGFSVEVLNVGDVVYYIDAYLSDKLKKTYPINEKNVLIAELGAGSLDISVMEKGVTVFNFGFPIGTLRLKQFKSNIEASQKETYLALEEYVDIEISNLKRSIPDIKLDDVILIDESYSTALHHIISDQNEETNFFPLKYRQSKQLLNRVTRTNLADMGHKYSIPTDIADTMDSYALILNKLFRIIKKRSIFILVTSLSEAILANIIFNLELGQKYNKSNQLVSVAKFLCRKFNADLKHSRQVAVLAEGIFKSFKDMLGLNDDELLYLVLASYLHNIGHFINNRSHHKHSEYIINTLSLFRLTAEEIKCIACIARYHRKAVPQRTHYLFGGLPAKEQLLVQKLSSILRIANALDAAHKQKVKRIEIELPKSGEIVINAYAQDSLTLEKIIFENRKKLYEEISGNSIYLKVKVDKT